MYFRVFCDPEAPATSGPEKGFGIASIAVETPHGDLDARRLIDESSRFRSKEDLVRYLARTFDVPRDHVSLEIE